MYTFTYIPTQLVPEKMRLEKLVETQIDILDGQSSCLFSNEPFKKRPGTTIENVGLHSNDHFESHLLGNGLYIRVKSHVTPVSFSLTSNHD